MGNKYFTCALCHQNFEMDRPDDEAKAELKEYFGDVPINECDIVCDDCWENIKPR